MTKASPPSSSGMKRKRRTGRKAARARGSASPIVLPVDDTPARHAKLLDTLEAATKALEESKYAEDRQDAFIDAFHDALMARLEGADVFAHRTRGWSIGYSAYTRFGVLLTEAAKRNDMERVDHLRERILVDKDKLKGRRGFIRDHERRSRAEAADIDVLEGLAEGGHYQTVERLMDGDYTFTPGILGLILLNAKDEGEGRVCRMQDPHASRVMEELLPLALLGTDLYGEGMLRNAIEARNMAAIKYARGYGEEMPMATPEHIKLCKSRHFDGYPQWYDKMAAYNTVTGRVCVPIKLSSTWDNKDKDSLVLFNACLPDEVQETTTRRMGTDDTYFMVPDRRWGFLRELERRQYKCYACKEDGKPYAIEWSVAALKKKNPRYAHER